MPLQFEAASCRPSPVRRPPRLIRVLGQRIQVFTGLNKPDQIGAALHDTDHRSGRSGIASIQHGMIGVQSNQSDDQLADTFLHETLHIMLGMVSHDDEDTVFRLTPVLLDFMRRNPRAVEFLMGEPYRLIR